MSDIKLQFSLLDDLVLAILVGLPGIGLGGLCGALIWRGRRLSGAMLGAPLGWAAGLAAFEAWSRSDASVHLNYAAALVTGALHALPGALVGAAVGGRSAARAPRDAVQTSRTTVGLLVGAALGLVGWRLISGGL